MVIIILKRLYFLILVAFAAIPALFIYYGCSDSVDDIIKTIEIDLATVTLSSPEFALAPGNPDCGFTSMDNLLDSVSDWEFLEDHLVDIDIKEILYMITSNTTPVSITGSLKLTDTADTSTLADIGSANILTTAPLNTWTNLPFVEGGKATVQHYLDHRNETFQYCAEGSPDDDQLSITIKFRLKIDVTVDIDIDIL